MHNIYRYKITIEYLGTSFVGWQRQQNGITIQQLIEEALSKLFQEPITIIAAGRTDAGVHAMGQVAHFDTVKYRSPNQVVGATNYLLKPHTITLLDCELVDENFHARFSATQRYYIYRIVNRQARLIIDENKAWCLRPLLDINAMQEAANYLLGEHDFTSFRASQCQASSPIKTLGKLEISTKQYFGSTTNNPATEITLYFSARSFLHHMVRNIVGSLVLVGLKKWQPQKIQKVLLAKDRTKAGPTAPACGLYFLKVDYF